MKREVDLTVDRDFTQHGGFRFLDDIASPDKIPWRNNYQFNWSSYKKSRIPWRNKVNDFILNYNNSKYTNNTTTTYSIHTNYDFISNSSNITSTMPSVLNEVIDDTVGFTSYNDHNFIYYDFENSMFNIGYISSKKSELISKHTNSSRYEYIRNKRLVMGEVRKRKRKFDLEDLKYDIIDDFRYARRVQSFDKRIINTISEREYKHTLTDSIMRIFREARESSESILVERNR